MQPKVSVIIPVYNVENYIERCLDSALSQTLEPIEIICVDDGSSDNSSAILGRYAERHANIRVAHQKNSGSSVARNRGLDLATGEYIAFLDSDDWYVSPDALEQIYERAVRFDADELFFKATACCSEEFFAFMQKDIKSYFFSPECSFDAVSDGKTMFSRLYASGDFAPYIWRRLYRRAFLEENHLRFIEGIVHQDLIFVAEAAALSNRSVCCDVLCYERYMRPDSITTSFNYSRSIYAHCVGTLALTAFADRIRDGSNPDFERAFDKYIREWEGEAIYLYLQLSRAERRAFWKSVPDADSERIRDYFQPLVLVAQRRAFFARIRRGVKRRLPPSLWSLMKRCKDRLKGIR